MGTEGKVMEGTLKEVLRGEKSWHLICNHVIDGLKTIPDGCFHCAVTSPPYYGLRSYLQKGHKDKKKEIGLEETPAEYISRMGEVFREVRRVLHETGVLWVNIGDSYSTHRHDSDWMRGDGYTPKMNRGTVKGYQEKSLLGIPHRLSQAMQADGWILRADVVWVKAAAMPESVSGWRWERCRVKTSLSKRSRTDYTSHGPLSPQGITKNGGIDESAQYKPCPGCPKCEPNDGLVLRRGSWRPTRAHEHIFLFAKSDRYYCDGEAVRTRIEEATKIRDTYSRILQDKDEQFAVQHDHETPSNPAGANLRDWWLLKQQQLDEGHYAAFPPSLPAMCIKAGTSQRGVCKKCGMPWAGVVERKEIKYRPNSASNRGNADYDALTKNRGAMGVETKTLCWRPTCSCNADVIPALVLDPFTGSGTSGIIAQKLGRRFVGIDLSEKYIEIARRRIRRRGHGKAPPKDRKKEVGGFF